MHYKSDDTRPRFSILIPAYEYPEGISRILDTLATIDAMDFEIIISDDSTTNYIEKIVQFNELCSKGILKYNRNSPGLGAVNNWNYLINSAKSDILVLLHHDEFFNDPNGLYRVVEEIACGRADVVVGKVKLLKNIIGRSVLHFPLFLSRFLIAYFPEYIYFRNFIGPVSCVIFRKNLSINFDENLCWMVDVDFYYRLRLKTKKWLFLDRHEISSIINRPNSITAQIKSNLHTIAQLERNYLCGCRTRIFLLNYHSNLIVKSFDFILWTIISIIWRIYRNIISFFKI